MTALRTTLTAAAALGLAACAPSGDEDSDTQGLPLGFELAAAKQNLPSEQSHVIDLSVAQLRQIQASGNIWLIDVRTDEEVAEGMIAGADHIPLDEFKPDQALLEKANGREIVLYCRSGRRSGIAGAKLAAVQGKPVRHLAGGYIAWREAGGNEQ